MPSDFVFFFPSRFMHHAPPWKDLSIVTSGLISCDLFFCLLLLFFVLFFGFSSLLFASLWFSLFIDFLSLRSSAEEWKKIYQAITHGLFDKKTPLINTTCERKKWKKEKKYLHSYLENEGEMKSKPKNKTKKKKKNKQTKKQIKT